VTLSPPERFPIRFERWYRLLSYATALPPREAYVELHGDAVSVRMGWAFRARFPRSAVARVARHEGRPLSRGVHGFGGRWLVNGSRDGILAIDFASDQRARLMGIPIRLRQLLVSVEDPDGLARRLQA
jgi:hypothetical protein